MLKLANSDIATSTLVKSMQLSVRLQACDGRKPSVRSLGANHHLDNVLVVRVSNLLHMIAVFFNLQRIRIVRLLRIVENLRNSGIVQGDWH